MAWRTGISPKVRTPTISFSGIVVSTGCYLLTEFALRPVAAQALEAGRPPQRIPTPASWAGSMTVWLLVLRLAGGRDCAGRVVCDDHAQPHPDPIRFRRQQFWHWSRIVFGFILMWISAWLTATPVRVVQAALKQVEKGDLNTSVGGVRRHGVRRAAARLQRDGRRVAGAGAATGPVRPPRWSGGRRRCRAAPAGSWAARNAMWPCCLST